MLRISTMRSHPTAIVLIVVLLAYFAIDNHVSLPPWNQLGETGPQLLSTLTAVIPFGLVVLALSSRIRWGTMLGAGWALVWLVLQIRQWWLPYLFGPTPLHSDFSWYAAHGYARTLRFLPDVAGRPVPDAQHLLLQLLSLAVFVALVAAIREAPPLNGEDG